MPDDLRWLRRFASPALGRFLLVGTSNLALSYAVFRGCLWVLPEVPLKATLSWFICYAAGVLWSFMWNRSWTFKSRGPVGQQAIRFVLLQVGMAVLSSALMGAAVDHWGLPLTPSWVLVAAVVTWLNFAGSRYWVFVETG
jgi:putative flippase GtrA